MRVVGGSAKGRKLVAPPGRTTRPTADAVREAVFNVLASRVDLEGARVLDLFAGSGALGIEALSRGAAHVTFVDAQAQAVAAIRANLAATGLDGSAQVVKADVLRWLETQGGRPRSDDALTVVFADPPYEFDDWDHLLGAVGADLVVCESDRPVVPPGPWEVRTEKRYGTTVVTLVGI